MNLKVARKNIFEVSGRKRDLEMPIVAACTEILQNASCENDYSNALDSIQSGFTSRPAIPKGPTSRMTTSKSMFGLTQKHICLFLKSFT